MIGSKNKFLNNIFYLLSDELSFTDTKFCWHTIDIECLIEKKF